MDARSSGNVAIASDQLEPKFTEPHVRMFRGDQFSADSQSWYPIFVLWSEKGTFVIIGFY